MGRFMGDFGEFFVYLQHEINKGCRNKTGHTLPST